MVGAAAGVNAAGPGMAAAGVRGDELGAAGVAATGAATTGDDDWPAGVGATATGAMVDTSSSVAVGSTKEVSTGAASTTAVSTGTVSTMGATAAATAAATGTTGDDPSTMDDNVMPPITQQLTNIAARPSVISPATDRLGGLTLFMTDTRRSVVNRLGS